jgi:hypothetical protein
MVLHRPVEPAPFFGNSKPGLLWAVHNVEGQCSALAAGWGSRVADADKHRERIRLVRIANEKPSLGFESNSSWPALGRETPSGGGKSAGRQQLQSEGLVGADGH